MSFFGFETTYRMRIDSSAALGSMRREGAGRVKHIQIKAIWIQQMVKDGILDVIKEETAKNRADLGTKVLHGPRLRLLCRMCGLRGRALQEDDPAGAGARASSSSSGASSEPDDEFVKRVLAFIARGIQG